MGLAARSEADLLDSFAREERALEPDPLIGRVVADRYRIVGHLGRGGMGVVYKVEHLRIGKLMAMKLLSGELSRSREVVRRFKREALAASRLTSVNTVQVWDFGHSDGLTYLVMELVAGEDLGKVLKREGPLPFRRVAQIAVQVCNSMREAHERGIVHRDLKPENILVLHPSGGADHDEGRERAEARTLTDLVKVLDFGLAKLHDDDRPHTHDVAAPGAIVGTPYYMAPEQIRGEMVDGRADIYALGAVMYRALTGVPPFVAENPMGVLTQHLTEPVIPPHERRPDLNISREASAIILKAMEKAREDRYASAAELREALIDHLASLGVSNGSLRVGVLESLAASGLPANVRASRMDVDSSVSVATRGEVSEYGRRLRRSGLLATAIAILAVAAIVMAARSMRPRAPAINPNEEREPNDTTAAANPLALGTPSTGYIGKRLAPDHGDVDHWSIEVPRGPPEPLLEIALTPLPNMGLCVELLADPSGASLATFCRGPGSVLEVGAFRVRSGRHWLRVFQDRFGVHERQPVYENVSDTYALRVALAHRTADLEIEPNGDLAHAQALGPGDAIDATLGWRGDRDYFCAAVPEGEARFRIERANNTQRVVVDSFVDGAATGRALLDAVSWLGASFAAPRRACVGVSTPDSLSHAIDSYRVALERM